MNRAERRAAVARHAARIKPALDVLDTDEARAVMLGRLIGPGPDKVGIMADETVLAGLHKARLQGFHPALGITDTQREKSRAWLSAHGFEVPAAGQGTAG